MPLFISYSRQDKEFVDRLAMALVQARARVWLDRWELNVGDSLTQRIQDALEGSDALLVVLSPASVASEWCKRELSAGLIRELEEKRVVVLPLLLADCDMPIFLRDKLYADFRSDFGAGLQEVLKAVARAVTTNRGRVETPEWHNDWGLDYGVDSVGLRIVMTFIESAMGRPYTVQVIVTAFGDHQATARYLVHKVHRLDTYYVHGIVDLIAQAIITSDLRVILGNRNPHTIQLPLKEPETNATFDLRIESRLLGSDTGSDVLIDLSNLLKEAREHMLRGNRPMTDSERERIRSAIAELNV